MSSPTIHPARQASPWYLAVPRLTVVHTLALLVALGASPVRAADTDGDGLDDDWEQALAELYRPIMRFDALEDHWPSSARWVAERSKLRTASNCSLTDDRSRATDVFSEAELAENPMRALRADERGFDPSNYAFATFSEDCFTLDLIDQSSARGGEGGVTNPNRVEGDPVVLPTIPIYVQVHQLAADIVPASEAPIDTTGLMVVYYFYSFAYNDTCDLQACIERHDGDWERIQVFVDPEVDPFDTSAFNRRANLRGTRYFAHKCVNTRVPGEPGFPSDDGIPDVYVEGDNHGFYPQPVNGLECIPRVDRRARGNDEVYRVERVVNLGEPASPILYPGEDIGACWLDPPGLACPPAFQDRLLAGLLLGKFGNVVSAGHFKRMLSLPRPWPVVYVDTSASPVLDEPITPVGEPARYYGTRFHPLSYFVNTATFTWVAAGGTVRFWAGQHDVSDYSYVEKPMRLEAVGGPALLHR